MKKCLLYLLVTIGINLTSICQVDPHFTQYYSYPLFLNPALTGVINEGNIRGTAIHRNQWNTLTVPFSTIGISADALLNNQWGIGLNMTNQTAGSGGYYYNTLALSICNNNIAFGTDEFQHISIAVQAGLNSKGFNISKSTFGDQYNPVLGYDPNIVSSAPSFIKTNSMNQFDAGFGFYYYETSTEKNNNYYGGISILHINKVKDNFTLKSAILPMRFNFHAGGILDVSDQLRLYPGFIYLQQGNSNEIVAGLQSEFIMSENASFLLGANYRLNSALNSLAGFRYKKINLGFSYDVDINKINDYIKPVNSFEFSLSFTAEKSSNPTVYFSKCPRY